MSQGSSEVSIMLAWSLKSAGKVANTLFISLSESKEDQSWPTTSIKLHWTQTTGTSYLYLWKVGKFSWGSSLRVLSWCQCRTIYPKPPVQHSANRFQRKWSQNQPPLWSLHWSRKILCFKRLWSHPKNCSGKLGNDKVELPLLPDHWTKSSSI